MKRLARHILLAAAALLAVACTEGLTEETGRQGGAATFAIAAPQSRAEAEGPEEEAYPWNRCAIRIYKKTEEGRELIRRYNKRSELPESLWLLAGDYTIAVEAGSMAEATFTEPTYAGETDFAIADGRTTMVEVECRIVNTMVKVAYDATVAATFKESYSTEVVFGDPANTRAPRLTYDGNATGYFVLPAEPTTLNWTFRGKGEKNGRPLELEKTGAKELTPEPGVRYELKYSADLGGALDFVLTLDENPDEVDDPIVFVPVPQIAGDGFDLTETQEYLTGTRSYRITSIADMATIAVGAAGEVFTIPATGNYAADANGIALEYANPTEMRLTLGEAFFALLPAGEHTVTLTATDADEGESTKETKVRMLQGAYALTSTDGWNARGRLEALVHDAASAHDVKIRYRRAGTTEWTVAEAAPADSGKYAADAADIHANTAYEYQLLFGEEPVNGIARTTMGDGTQIPNADFEQWSGSSPLLPYLSGGPQWWDTGNHGSSTMNKNVTTNVDDPRPGSAGRTAAKLQSQFVGVGSIGKFAAGNLFVGQYLGTNGTNGVIGFSKAFDFTYRPKKLRFWYKGNTGTIDNADSASGKSKGDSDISTVYLCLCATAGPHITNTADAGTFFASTDRTIKYCTNYTSDKGNTNDAEGHVIGAAVWEKDNSYQQTEWKKIEVDVEYYPEYEGEKPAYLLLIASASKYGDYFTGSTASVMYLDDLEIVY